MRQVGWSGERQWRLWVLGEAPGREEEERGEPFVGASGRLLRQAITDMGGRTDRARFGNVVQVRPPGNDIGQWMKGKQPHRAWGKVFSAEVGRGLEALHAELAQAPPGSVVLALGNVALWALTGSWGIDKWRGSMLYANPLAPAEPPASLRVLPTFHPAAVLRAWTLMPVFKHDVRRAIQGAGVDDWPQPDFDFTENPTFEEALGFLREIREPPACDIETTGRQISIVGFATSARRALCIPLVTQARGRIESVWTEDQERSLWAEMRRILTDVGVIGQNFHYDAQYLVRWAGIWPRLIDDTSWMQHALMPSSKAPGERKSLDFLASLYCRHYTYWKDELKDYKTLPTDEGAFRRYNCVDCVRTWEVHSVLRGHLEKSGMDVPYRRYMLPLYEPVLGMMVRGTRVDQAQRAALACEMRARKRWLERNLEGVVGRNVGTSGAAPWYRSPKQIMTLFYEGMGVRPRLDPHTRRPTARGSQLKAIKGLPPIGALLADWLAEYGSLDTLLEPNGFLCGRLDPDGRTRCNYNVAGTVTFRFTSSRNAFGGGFNLQNIPRGSRYRRLFVADPGWDWVEVDFSQADLRCVVAYAECRGLQELLDAGKDPYTEAARAYYGDASITKADPRRQTFKSVAHALNYGGGPRTISQATGLDLRGIERLREWWFRQYPEIKQWHALVLNEVQRTRTLYNAWGFRRIFNDRLEAILPEALAWLGQSTVSVATNVALLRLWGRPDITLLMQIHDSVCLQVRGDGAMAAVEEAFRTPVPFRSGPLVLPFDIKRPKGFDSTPSPHQKVTSIQ